jgi:endonuclease-3 related protein
MVGALLVQRTAWRNAAQALEQLRRAGGLDPERLSQLSAPAMEAFIRPAGFYRTKSERLRGLAQFIVSHGGPEALARLPTAMLRARFLRLPGIGPETADAILLYAFERPVFVVDAYARRLFRRLDGRRDEIADDHLKLRVETAVRRVAHLNELHALIVAHGKLHCSRVPRCAQCCLRTQCRAAA